MMKLRKCNSCKQYTLKKSCPKCNQPTKQAGYKFLEFTGKIYDKTQ